MKKLVFVFIITISCNTLYSQKLELTTEDKKEFKRRTIRMIELFKESLQIIPRFNSEPILKDKAISNVLRMFVKGAKIQIATNNKTLEKKIATYLSSLTDYEAKRELVQIDIIDFTIDDVKPHPTKLGIYEIEYTFVQRFYKKKNYVNTNITEDENIESIEWDYIDDTTKSGKAMIKKVSTRNGTKWMMLLGDIKVDDIKVITKK